MKSNIWPVIVISVLLGQCQIVHAASPTPLCRAGENTVFSCHAKAKTVSVCAAGDLMSRNGKLTYRFGRSMEAVELEYSNAPYPLTEKFSLYADTWAKGTAMTLSFTRGDFEYGIYHASGVFGVDGGPNRAGVGISQRGKAIANVVCDEASAVDNMYELLTGLGLPTGPEY